MAYHESLIGQKFDLLLVTTQCGRAKDGRPLWFCSCDCGSRILVSSKALKTRHTRSCGCLGRDAEHRDAARQRASSHGLIYLREYKVWATMKSRCRNPKVGCYASYGARDITVCERWDKFENFIEDMGRAPAGMSLDRIDNNRGYSPDNCGWATRIEQARNRRDNRIITHAGISRTLQEWANAVGISRERISDRLKTGWAVADALETPVRYCGRSQ